MRERSVIEIQPIIHLSLILIVHIKIISSCIRHQVRDRKGVKTTTRELEDMEYDVSLLGGYSDEEEISQDITEMLLVVMQVPKIYLMIMDTHWMRSRIDCIAHKITDVENRSTIISLIMFPRSNKLFMIQGH